jgi:hypothetical protein
MNDQCLERKKSPKIITKGDNVMEDVEQEMKKQGETPKLTADSVLAKSLRKSIEAATRKLEKSAQLLVVIDWILFILAAFCMALISMGINYSIFANFDLAQLLAAISFSAKSAEKSFNLSSLAKDKQAHVRELKKFTQRISAIELLFYINSDKEDASINKVKITADIQEIWSKFNDIELETFLAPPRLDLDPEKHEKNN